MENNLHSADRYQPRLNLTLAYEVFHSRLPSINELASPGIYIQLVGRADNVFNFLSWAKRFGAVSRLCSCCK